MSSAVALHILWVVGICEVVGMQLYWMWIGKENGCSLLIIETGFSQNVIESNKNFFV